MQLTVGRDDLLKVAAPVVGVLPSKPVAPILSHVLLTAGERLEVQGTNQDIEISDRCAAEVKAQGRIAVAGRIFHDVIKRMPASKAIGLTLTANRAGAEVLKVVCGKSRFELAVLPAEDYPTLVYDASKIWSFEVEADRLRRMFAGVRHAISSDETRYYLNGIYFHIRHGDTGELRAVATNGHMLAMESIEAPPQSLTMPAIIIPRDTVQHMLKLLPDANELVQLELTERRLRLEVPGGWRLTSRLIDGTFPDYERVIPGDNPHHATVSADALLTSVDRVASLCDSSNHGINLFMVPGGPIRISTRHADLGIGQDSVEAGAVEGRKAAIGVNHRYLGAILSSLSGAMIQIDYNGTADPLRLSIEGEGRSLHVLMPMRTDASAELLDEAA